ncbi:MAG: helix-turn-helix domain-containing protein, partial [Nitrososphaerales archaeon]
MVKLTAEQTYQIILFLLTTIRSKRTEISRFTGASKSQVSRLVTSLLNAGVLRHT